MNIKTTITEVECLPDIDIPIDDKPKPPPKLPDGMELPEGWDEERFQGTFQHCTFTTIVNPKKIEFLNLGLKNHCEWAFKEAEKLLHWD